MKHKITRGRILYTSKKPERMDEERGREFFTLTQQEDGVRVIQVHCEIDDTPRVVRDVVLAMNKDGAPLDCSVRLSVGNRFEGSGWFRFTDSYAECEMINWRDGRISQRIETPKKTTWLQAHPIVGDAQLMRLYDLSKGPGKQNFKDIMLTSPDHRGATGPMLFQMSLGIRYIGEEEISIASGVYKARHFQVEDTADELPEEHPPYHLWCTADDEYLFLKAGAEGYMQTHYELATVEYF